MILTPKTCTALSVQDIFAARNLEMSRLPHISTFHRTELPQIPGTQNGEALAAASGISNSEFKIQDLKELRSDEVTV